MARASHLPVELSIEAEQSMEGVEIAVSVDDCPVGIAAWIVDKDGTKSWEAHFAPVDSGPWVYTSTLTEAVQVLVEKHRQSIAQARDI